MENTFSNWLQKELDKRGLNQHQLAKLAGISPGTVSNIMNGNRGIGENSLASIARALHLPAEEVFRAAGLLPPISAANSKVDELNYLLSQMEEGEIDEIIAYARFRLNRAQKNENTPVKQSSRRKNPARKVLVNTFQC